MFLSSTGKHHPTIEYVANEKGVINLFYKGHRFEKEGMRNERQVYWACTQRRVTKCKVRVIQNLEMNRLEFRKIIEHNHEIVRERRKKGEAKALKALCDASTDVKKKRKKRSDSFEMMKNKKLQKNKKEK